jgi:translation initiation factor IF-3
MDRSAALQLAKDQELDLIEVSSDTDPPIAKIADWGKYNYNKIKQQKKNRRNTKIAELKQIRISLKIGDHDLEIKLNKTLKFIEQGHKVKFSLLYRGREQAHKELGFQLAERILNTLGEQISVDQPPNLQGRQLSFVIRSNNAKVKNP